MKCWTTIVSVLLAVLAATAAPDNTVRFRWAIAKAAAEGAQEVLPGTNALSMASGTQFRLHFISEAKQFFYVVLVDARGDATPLWPASETPHALTPAGASFAMPGADMWFELDQTKGTETFHILASDVPLEKIAVAMAGLSATDKTAKATARDELLAEIKALKRKTRRFASEGEKPVPIAGSIRSALTDIDIKATEEIGAAPLIKTLRIEHF